MLRTFLACDIETKASADAYGWLPEPAAPANYKDPDKIAAAKAEKRSKDIEKLSLDPWGSTPFVITTQTELDAVPLVRVCLDDAALELALRDVVNLRHAPDGDTRAFVGFCVRRFDLAHLAHHARRLGVPWPRLDLRRYGPTFDCLDLYDILCDDDTEHVISRSLKSTCRIYGVPVPEDDCDGADVAALVAADDFAAVTKHCAADVARVVALGRRLRFLAPARGEAMAAAFGDWVGGAA